MKKEVRKDQASRLTGCGGVVLVTAVYKDRTTITPCAWQMPLSKNPPCLGVALAKGHFSSEAIRRNGEFIVNIPHWGLLDKIVFCGKRSGRDVDKFEETKLTKQKADALIKTPKIGECIGHLECSLIDIKEAGDHFLFLGEVIRAEAEEDYFKEGFWDTSKVDLIYHLGAKFFCKASPYVEFGR